MLNMIFFCNFAFDNKTMATHCTIEKGRKTEVEE